MKTLTFVSSFTRRAAGLLVLAALLIAPTRAVAQQSGAASSPEPGTIADRMVTAMAQQLSLSEEQQTELRPILTEAVEEQQALLDEFRQQEGDASPQDLRDDLQEVQEEVDSDLSDVLTQEQMQQYEQMRKQQAQQRRQQSQQRRQQMQQGQGQQMQQGQGRQQSNPIDAAIAQLDQALDLTDEQVSQLRPIFEEQAQQMRSMQQSMRDASPEERQQQMEQMRSAQEETTQQIESILNEEQLEQFRALQEQQRQAMEQRRQQMEQQRQQMMQGQEDDSMSSEDGGSR